jgi:hypothetical protein
MGGLCLVDWIFGPFCSLEVFEHHGGVMWVCLRLLVLLR